MIILVENVSFRKSLDDILSFSRLMLSFNPVANSTNILIDYTGGKASCTNTKVRMVIKCTSDDEDDKKITLKSFDEDECYYLFVFSSKLLCKYE